MENKNDVKKVVMAYSGGLDTSVALCWLKEHYHCEVIACCINVGQGDEELKNLDEKAQKTGASKTYIIDARQEFIIDYIYPAIKANAIYEDKYLLGTALARPIIAAKIIDIVKKENADAVCHGATGKGNDQVRFELAFKALMPNIKIIAIWREWEIKSRAEAIQYAKKRNILISVTKDKPYSSDANIWHISYEGGNLEDLNNSYDNAMFKLTMSVELASTTPSYVSIEFERGIPVAINDKRMSPINLITTLNKLAGSNGVGRIDIIENRLVGIKSRGVYEAPAATVLYFAHKEIESISIDRDTLHFKQLISNKYAEIIYYGLWFSPLREALEAFINSTQKYVTGKIVLKLYKGIIEPISRESKYSLYNKNLATFEEDKVYNHRDAEGFINIFGLTTKCQALLKDNRRK
ncbi:MAG: argininosuccinate synthase [Endomicrobium sp.]|jgi:argininosuccinate synthase|nr:argininosuccinate synthase [Endomicrobium sp.]